MIDTSAVGAPKLMGKKILRDWAAADTARPTLSEFLSLLDVRDGALPNIEKVGSMSDMRMFMVESN